MSEERWLTDIKNRIEEEVDLNLWSLERLAEENDVEVNYVLETYRDKMVYKINKMTR